MDHFFKFIYVVLICVGFCSVNNVNGGNTPESEIHQTRGKISPLWFGPRMGRKKRDETFGGRITVSELLEALNEYPWTLTAVNFKSEMKKRDSIHNFTPRLGRTLGGHQVVEDQTDVAERSLNYLPLTGRDRHLNPYSPRLGRDEPGVYL